MLSAVTIEGFKGIKFGRIGDLSQVNLLVGKNNTGKSSFLQSLYLFNENRNNELIPDATGKDFYWLYNPEPIKLEVILDGKSYHLIYDKSTKSKRIFYDVRDYQKDLPFHIVSSEVEKQKTYFFDIQAEVLVNEEGLMASKRSDRDKTGLSRAINQIFGETLWSSVLVNRVNFLEESSKISSDIDNLQNKLGLEKPFLKTLSEAYDLSLSELRYSPTFFKGWSVKVDDGKSQIPVYLESLGDGTRTAISIMLKLWVARPKIILLDEIESHQHVKALRHTLKAIISFAKENNSQLFISTHSLDAIRSCLELAQESELESKIHHFNLEGGFLTKRTIHGLDAKVVTEMNDDIRYLDDFA